MTRLTAVTGLYTMDVMSDLRVRNIDEDEIDTVLGADVEFEGDLVFDQLVLIKGRINGDLRSSSDVFISAAAEVEASLEAQVISVKGMLHGDVHAIRRLELFSTGQVKGSIRTPDMIMQSGAKFNGTCRMDGDTSRDIAAGEEA